MQYSTVQYSTVQYNTVQYSFRIMIMIIFHNAHCIIRSSEYQELEEGAVGPHTFQGSLQVVKLGQMELFPDNTNLPFSSPAFIAGEIANF